MRLRLTPSTPSIRTCTEWSRGATDRPTVGWKSVRHGPRSRLHDYLRTGSAGSMSHRIGRPAGAHQIPGGGSSHEYPKKKTMFGISAEDGSSRFGGGLITCSSESDRQTWIQESEYIARSKKAKLHATTQTAVMPYASCAVPAAEGFPAAIHMQRCPCIDRIQKSRWPCSCAAIPAICCSTLPRGCCACPCQLVISPLNPHATIMLSLHGWIQKSSCTTACVDPSALHVRCNPNVQKIQACPTLSKRLSLQSHALHAIGSEQ